MKNRILIGMSLKEYHRHLLGEKGLDYSEVRLHDFTFVHDVDRVRQGLQEADALVITSGRAMQALRGISGDITEVPAYVVGHRTARRMVRFGFTDIKSAHNCEELIALNPWNQEQQLLYLCGNLRRDILPDFWTAKGIPFEEMEVYQTHLLYPEVNPGEYDIALISSPSGVRSLIRDNAFPEDFRFASIGPVTSAELRKHGFHNIVEPPQPSFELLIDEIVKAGV